MSNKKVIPFNVPRVGGNNNQQLVDLSQMVQKFCECGCQYFDKACKVGLISALAPGNRTGQDIPAEMIVYLCRECGKELRLMDKQGDNKRDGKLS